MHQLLATWRPAETQHIVGCCSGPHTLKIYNFAAPRSRFTRPGPDAPARRPRWTLFLNLWTRSHNPHSLHSPSWAGARWFEAVGQTWRSRNLLLRVKPRTHLHRPSPPYLSRSSRFLRRSPRGSELTWGDSLPALTKLNLNYRPPPPCFCSTWRRRKRRATQRSCAGGCASQGRSCSDPGKMIMCDSSHHFYRHTHSRDR